MSDKLSPGRPSVRRDAKTFLRDIDSLRRLKISLIRFHMNNDIAQEAVIDIDKLIGRLYILRTT